VVAGVGRFGVLHARVWRELGADVVGPVPTWERALAHLNSGERVDLAVLGINLRGELAFPVADALTRKGIPFVFATGYEADAIPSVYQDVPVWQKPFDPQELARALVSDRT